MKLLSLLAATAILATSGAAFSQEKTNPESDIKAFGTIGPTVTANPTPQSRWRDPDTGRYGVHGGVGDPSVGANLAGRTWNSRSVSLRPRRAY